MDYDFGIADITLHYFYDKTRDVPIPDLETTQIVQYSFKYVIIQGSAITSKSAASGVRLKQKLTADGVDLDDYLEVADYFKLED